MNSKGGAMPLEGESRRFPIVTSAMHRALSATGVVVITNAGNAGRDDGDHSGSRRDNKLLQSRLDPPLIRFSIGRISKAFAAWQSVDTLAVNILGEKQSSISTRFAR